MPAALYRHFQTQAEIDAAYNPSLQVADAAAELRHFAEAAQRARATLRHQLDLPYGATLAETLDIFPADPSAQGSGPGAAPVFVFLHGGYWRALSSRDFSGIALGLGHAGLQMARLAPAVKEERNGGAGHHGDEQGGHRVTPLQQALRVAAVGVADGAAQHEAGAHAADDERDAAPARRPGAVARAAQAQQAQFDGQPACHANGQ